MARGEYVSRGVNILMKHLRTCGVEMAASWKNKNGVHLQCYAGHEMRCVSVLQAHLGARYVGRPFLSVSLGMPVSKGVISCSIMWQMWQKPTLAIPLRLPQMGVERPTNPNLMGSG